MSNNDDDKVVDDLSEEVHDLMDQFDLDEREAKKVEKMEDEGYDEEDAVSQVVDEL